MPQNAFFLRTRNLLISPKTMQRHFLFTLHPLSTVIFATATVLAFVLLRNSNFNFHCYTQREATPTQKSARKCAATSRDFLRERLQSTFTLANQLRWIAQYSSNWQIRYTKYSCESTHRVRAVTGSTLPNTQTVMLLSRVTSKKRRHSYFCFPSHHHHPVFCFKFFLSRRHGVSSTDITMDSSISLWPSSSCFVVLTLVTDLLR